MLTEGLKSGRTEDRERDKQGDDRKLTRDYFAKQPDRLTCH